MKKAVRRAVLGLAVATSVTMVTGGPAGAAGAARTGAPGAALTAVAAGLRNHQITGTERAVGCLTAVRCVAVGSGIPPGPARRPGRRGDRRQAGTGDAGALL